MPSAFDIAWQRFSKLWQESSDPDGLKVATDRMLSTVRARTMNGSNIRDGDRVLPAIALHLVQQEQKSAASDKVYAGLSGVQVSAYKVAMKDVVQQMNLDSPRASRTRSSASVSPTKSHVSTPKTAQRYSGTTPASKRGRKSQTTTPQPSPTKPKARTTATSQKARDGEGGGRLELMNPHASRSTTRRETEMDAMHARQEEEESPTRNAYGLKQSAKSPFLSPLPPVAGSSKDVISPAGQQSAETPTRRGTRSDPRAQAQLGSSAVAVTPTKRGRGAPRTPLRAVDVVDADQAAEEAAQREADREVLEQADEDERQARSKARRRVLWDFELDDQVREWMDVNEEEEKAWRADMREQLLVLLAEHDE